MNVQFIRRTRRGSYYAVTSHTGKAWATLTTDGSIRVHKTSRSIPKREVQRAIARFVNRQWDAVKSDPRFASVA